MDCSTRLPCPTPSPRACSNSSPLIWWCHPTTSSSVAPFFCCIQSFPASGSFPMSQLFTSGGQSNGASASALVPPLNIQDWFLLRLTDLISLQSKGLSRILSSTIWKASILWRSAFFMVQLSHPYMTPGKNIALTIWRARRSNQSMLKEINPKYSLEGLMLKLKLQYFGHLMWMVDSQEKTLILEKIRGQEKWATEDEMVWWHYWLNGHEFEQTPGDKWTTGKPWRLQFMGLQRVRYDLVTSQIWLSDWTTTFVSKLMSLLF